MNGASSWLIKSQLLSSKIREPGFRSRVFKVDCPQAANNHVWYHMAPLALFYYSPTFDYTVIFIEWLGWTFENYQIIKTCHLLGKLLSLVRNIFYFFYGQSQIGSAPKSSWRQKQKIILPAMHAFYVCVPLAPRKNARGIACIRVLAELFLVCSALWHRCW